MENEIVYVSGKITGDEYFREKFENKANELRAKGAVVLLPTFITAELDYEQYMHIDFAMLDCATVIYMMKDYVNSKGALRELSYAKAKGIRVEYE